ncbi:uncharacterized protein FTOL_06892 [Fusarium torulosum]|uniref:Uncharacterized protein n=1 Tax=Fusarium torulosum TaxID=33205 RepID=A0AAE8SII5_9HYPO|nr:uncharacterized protein FTOL_06892 [Fusarium torulosum]
MTERDSNIRSMLFAELGFTIVPLLSDAHDYVISHARKEGRVDKADKIERDHAKMSQLPQPTDAEWDAFNKRHEEIFGEPYGFSRDSVRIMRHR